MSYKTILLLAIALFAGLSSSAFAADYVKVGFWNIENLGSRTPAQRPIAIAEHIQLSGVEVLALCEIHVDSTQGGERRNDTLDTSFAICNEEDGQDWTYELFPNRNENDKTQLCGVAWNQDAVSKVGDTFKIPVSNEVDSIKLWDRHPHAIKFEAEADKTDFVLIPVHMKSNVPSAQVGRERRLLEAKELVAQLGDVRDEMEDKDVIIIGDTNILKAEEAAAQEFVGAGYRDLNSSDAGTFVRGKAPFDRIFVPKGRKPTTFSRQYVLRSAEPAEHEEYLSDHYKILTVVKVVADDD